MTRLALAASVAAMLAIAGCSSMGRGDRPGGMITRFAAADLLVRTSVDVPGNPCGIAAAGGAVYVTDLGASTSGDQGAGALTVLHRDSTRQRHVALGDRAPCLVAAVPRGALVAESATSLARVTSRVDWRTAVARELSDLAVRGRAAWVADRAGHELVKVDIRTGRVLLRVRGIPSPADVATVAGAAWVAAADATGGVLRFDPRSGRRTLARAVGPSVLIAAAGRRAFVVTEDNRLLALDARTGRVLARRSVSVPEDLTAGAGAVWLLGDDGRVLKLDPRTLAVRARARVAGDPFGIAVDGGEVVVGARRPSGSRDA